MKRLLLLLSIFGIIIFFANALYAADPVTTQIQVSANVVATCSVQVTDVDFGDISGAGPFFGTGDVTVNCAFGTPYEITLDSGLHWDSTTRNMANNTDLIPYGLYSDSGHDTPWGDSDSNFYGGVSDSSNGSDQPHSVFGMAQNTNLVPPGAYSDTVEVIVSY